MSSPFRLDFWRSFVKWFEKYLKQITKFPTARETGRCTHGDGGPMGGMVSPEMSCEIARMVVSTVFGNCEKSSSPSW